MKRYNMNPFRLGILTAIWGRPELTSVVLGYYAALRLKSIRALKTRQIDLTRIAAVTGESVPDGWTAIEVPNTPLGAKWNAGLKAFEETDVEAVMIVGSDDLVSESYIRLAVENIDRHPYIQPDDMYLYSSGRCVLASPFPGGPGRIIRRDVLEQLRWKLWPDNVDRYLDSQMNHRVERIVKCQFCPSHKRHKMCIVDVKGGQNMWHLHPSEPCMISEDGRMILIHVAEEVNGEALLRKHFPNVAIAGVQPMSTKLIEIAATTREKLRIR